MTNTIKIFYEEHPMSPRLLADNIGYLITLEDNKYDSCIEERKIYGKIRECIAEKKTLSDTIKAIKESFEGIQQVYGLISSQIEGSLKIKRGLASLDLIDTYHIEEIWGLYIITDESLLNFYQRKGLSSFSEEDIKNTVQKELQEWSYYVSGEVFHVKEYDKDGRWMIEKRNIYGFSEISKYLSDESKNRDLNECLIDQ